MYSWCSIVKGKRVYVAPEIFGLIVRIIQSPGFTISGIGIKRSLNLDLPADGNTKKCVDDSRNITPPVKNYGMIHILATLQKIMCGVVLHLVPTTCESDEIRAIIII